MDYKIVSSKNDIDELFNIYFTIIRGSYFIEALEVFSERNGFVVEYVGVFFKDGFDVYEKEYEMIKDDQICISISTPAIDENKEAFVNFRDFYLYLKNEAENAIVRNSIHESILRSLLEKVRIALNVDN